MGVFHTLREVINRSSEVLFVTFDGQRMRIEPNYTKDGKRREGVQNFLPEITLMYAKHQNPRMGSEDVYNPTSYESLIGIVAKPGTKQKDDLSFLEQSDEVTRVSQEDILNELVNDTKAKLDVRGKKALRGADASVTLPRDGAFAVQSR